MELASVQTKVQMKVITVTEMAQKKDPKTKRVLVRAQTKARTKVAMALVKAQTTGPMISIRMAHVMVRMKVHMKVIKKMVLTKASLLVQPMAQ